MKTTNFGTIKLAIIDYADVLNKNNMNKMRHLFRYVWDLIPDERIVKTTSGKGTQRVPKVCLRDLWHEIWEQLSLEETRGHSH